MIVYVHFIGIVRLHNVNKNEKYLPYLKARDGYIRHRILDSICFIKNTEIIM